MVRHHNTTKSAHDIIRRIVSNHPVALQIQREMKEEEQERQRAEAKYNRRLADLERRLRDTANASAADRVRLEQEIKKLQDRIATSAATAPHLTPYVQVLFCLVANDG